MDLTGFLIGIAFGATLFLSGLANPDKIVGTLRLKDFHVMRVIAVFVLVGMLGTWILSLFDAANFSVKPAYVLSVLLGGGLLGIGFGLTGYCPGTGIACAAAGRVDALFSLVGMLLGALAYILVYPWLALPLESVIDWGKQVLPEVTPIPYAAWVLGLFGLGAAVLWLTRPRPAAAKAAVQAPSSDA